MEEKVKIGDSASFRKIGIGKVSSAAVLSMGDKLSTNKVDMSPVFDEVFNFEDSVSTESYLSLKDLDLLSEFTEVDPYEKMTLTSDSIVIDVDDDVQAEKLYQDYGEDFFGRSFTHRFEIRPDPIFGVIPWALSNTEDWTINDSNEKATLACAFTDSTANFYLRMEDEHGTTEERVDFDNERSNYYVEIKRRNTTDLIINISKDSNFDSIIESIEGRIPKDLSFRYLFVVKGYEDSSLSDEKMTGSGELTKYELTGI